jgi:omega-amidase
MEARKSFKLALLQLKTCTDRAKNLKRAEEMILEASSRGA